MLNQGLGSWIHRRRPKSGPKAAVIFDGVEISYAQLSSRIDRLAVALRQRGVEPGSRVAFLGENHPAFLETFFAAGTLGAIFVPLNTRLAPPEVQYALKDAGSTVLVHAESLTGLAIAGARETAVGRRIVVADGPRRPAPAGVDATESPDVIVEALDAVIGSTAQERLDVAVSLDDPAMILYTSGTTGSPKGAVLTHGNITWNCFNVLVDYDFVSTDVALMISPLFHVASLDMGLLPTLLKGGTVVLEPRFDPARALTLIEKYRVTSLSGVPTTFQMLCEHPDWATTDISSLEKLTCGGSAVPMRVLEEYERRGLAFSGGYGMTETSPGATSLSPEKSREKAGSGGLPHFFTDLRIVDADGRVLPPGESGEIQLSGPNVIKEYWNKPEVISACYVEGVWFRSGDMGHVDDDGYLFIADRLKDMIISGGENIYSAEVEQAVSELEAVGSVAIIGVPDEKWGEVPIAIVTVRDGFTLEPDEVRNYLDGRIARYKIPKRVEIVAELPRTASGKIRKAELRRLYPA
ncbi:acyl-CoA synthetase [Parafrigoribacterium humi]|jgi:fatty-acyl-CoA synthase|uniref:acyl-CoA synthetase n=1 Tax=Parafrigoribacterium humi TaxID=3144664 RepID=UPI0032ED7E1C